MRREEMEEGRIEERRGRSRRGEERGMDAEERKGKRVTKDEETDQQASKTEQGKMRNT